MAKKSKLNQNHPAVKASKLDSREQVNASKRIDLKKMSQTHGALASPTAAQYMTGYDTADASEYHAKLERMEGTELYDHAVSVGEVPIDDRDRLLRRLQDRFAQVQAASIPRQNIPMNVSAEGEAFLRKYMAGGV